jgi:hypothetical protein
MGISSGDFLWWAWRQIVSYSALSLSEIALTLRNRH